VNTGRSTSIVFGSALALLAGCGDNDTAPGLCDPGIVEVVSFTPGSGAGYGADRLPEIIQGPPDGGKTSEGSLSVLSLGIGGELIVRLGCAITDGDGVDFVVAENPFLVGAGGNAFVEPAEIAVSTDGVDFTAFPCTAPDSSVAADDGVDGCAGLAPVAANADNGLAGVFPDGGGDGFDLGTVGVDGVTFVRLRDRSTSGASPNAGFDLDAITIRSF
jgi:hypothetical protein